MQRPGESASGPRAHVRLSDAWKYLLAAICDSAGGLAKLADIIGPTSPSRIVPVPIAKQRFFGSARNVCLSCCACAAVGACSVAAPETCRSRDCRRVQP